jgi:hypothetical protein
VPAFREAATARYFFAHGQSREWRWISDHPLRVARMQRSRF